MKRKKLYDKKTIDTMIKSGCGQGEGKNYIPWIKIQDVASTGRKHRVYSEKLQRKMEFLSDNEYLFFLIFNWNDLIIDIREQFPILDLEETQRIAKKIGVKHPSYGSDCVIITSDFMLTILDEFGKYKYLAVTIKTADKLEEKRTLEKFAIEQEYYAQKEISWAIVLDEDLKTDFVSNLRLIYDNSQTAIVEQQASNFEIDSLLAYLKVYQDTEFLHLACSAYDRCCGNDEGTSISLFWKALQKKMASVDMETRIKPNKLLIKDIQFRN